MLLASEMQGSKRRRFTTAWTMKMGSNCSVSSAASTGYGLGIGHFCQTPPLGPSWKEDWSLRDMTGLNDEQVKDVLAQLGSIMTKEVKYCVDWAPSKENHGTWVEQTMVSLRFVTGTRKKGG